MSGARRRPRLAATDLAGPVRVVAGAGTGKTAVIAERFHRLVAAGSTPASILVMTFTERAAAEMRTRIEAGLGPFLGELWVGTFHSTALTLLREEGWRVGVPATFRVLAGADRWILMRELLWSAGDPALVGAERPDDLVGPLLRLLERLKQELIPLPRLEDWARSCEDRELGEQLLAAVGLFRAYARHCEAEKLLDFDDLIARLVRLLEQRPEVRSRLVKRFTAVLVDEYQDTNLAQERMVELLGGAGEVFVVGDDDQSIYRFRGASLASMERFARIFPGAQTLALGRNRRSSGNVVAAAAALIANNPDRLPKAIDASRPAGPRVDLVHAGTGLDESLQIAARIGELSRSGLPLRRIALLVRANALATPIVAALRAAGIPHQVWGARGFFRRPEVLDVIAYLRLLANPLEEIAVGRLATRPGAGLDPLEVLARLQLGREAGQSPLEALEAWPAAAAWVGLVRRLASLALRLGIDELFFELMSSTRYLEVAAFEDEIEQRQAAANLAKFGELIDGYRERSRDHSLPAFLAYLELVLLADADEEVAAVDQVEEAVQVMTIHQAKGLEFDAVFVPALVEGRLPQPHRGDRFRIPAQLAGEAAGREDQVAEERRLLYVAMTRARDRLQLSWADRYEGSRGWKPSRFLAEVEAAGPRRLRRREAPAAPAGLPPEDRLPAAPGAAPAVEAPWLSFSGISTYRECPRRYQYRYVFRLPVPPTAETQYGNIVHAALMRLGRRRMEADRLVQADVENVHEATWAEMPFADRRRQPALRALALKQLLGYWRGGGFDVRPALVEEPFTAQLEGWGLRGVIDRVDAPAGDGAGGSWRIVDYKTGDPMPASRLRRDLQLALYALGARQALGAADVELEIVYLKDASRVTLPATDGLLSEAARIGGEVAAAIAGGAFEPRPDRRRCALCPYRLLCPAAL